MTYDLIYGAVLPNKGRSKSCRGPDAILRDKTILKGVAIAKTGKRVTDAAREIQNEYPRQPISLKHLAARISAVLEDGKS